MDVDNQTIMWRLQTTLDELECEFHYFLGDVQANCKHELRDRPMFLRSVSYAAQNVAEAALALRRAPAVELSGSANRLGEPQGRELDSSIISMYKTAARNIAEGLSMFNEGRCLIFCNERYSSIYELPARLTRPGTRYEDIADYRLRHGMEPVAARKFLGQHAELLKEHAAGRVTATLGNGHNVVVRHQPVPGGGWIATHNDLTCNNSI